MRSGFRIALCILWLNLVQDGLAQSGILTTYVGYPLANDGGSATAQALAGPSGVVSDRAGGFYVASLSLNRVHRVTSTGTIVLVAGTGLAGFSGDGGPATSAQLWAPRKVTVDNAGNLYIADWRLGRVRKVTPSGVISTVAGSGFQGYAGDGGPATNAALNGPTGLAVDANGNLYIADGFENVVRKVSANGIISTYAGNHTSGYSGDGGPAVNAQLSSPYGLAVDAAGNLYIADNANSRVRKVTPAGIISTAAGVGVSGFSGDGGPATFAMIGPPADVAIDAAGNLYIADPFNRRIRRVTTGGTISTVAGNGGAGTLSDGGPATNAQLDYPGSVDVDSSNNIFIADTSRNKVRKVDASGVITTVAGVSLNSFGGDGGPATVANLNNPFGLAIDSGRNLYIADTGNHRIRKVAPDGIITTIAGNGIPGFSGDNLPATSTWLNDPRGVAVDANGNVYIADRWNNRVRKVGANGIITTIAGNGSVGSAGDGGPATSASLANPTDVAVDLAGNVFVSTEDGPSGSGSRVRKITPNGIINTVAGIGTTGFTGDGGPGNLAALNRPTGIAVDAEGNLYIADTFNSRVRKVAANGIITTVAGVGLGSVSGDGGPATSARMDPQDVAVDSNGNLFIAEGFNGRVRMVTKSGLISTVAGRNQAFSADGLPAIASDMVGADGIAVDADFNLYIADSTGSRVRKVSSRAKRDFNGDGRSDVLWRDTNGNVSMWQLRGYTIVSDTPIASIWTGWTILGTGDFNADGVADILWRDSGGTVVVWLMSGTTVTGWGIAGTLPLFWNVGGIADFNADGKADILWRSSSGDIAMWLMNGTTTLSTPSLGNIWTGWNVAGTADFNADGKADVLWRSISGDVAIWLMNGPFVLSGTVIGNIWTGWTIVGTGDLNGDGRGDILWRENGGDVAVWLMNGTSVLSGTIVGNIWTGWTIAGTGDFNGDGQTDILWRDNSGSVAIWTMDGAVISSYASMGNVADRAAQ